MPAYFDTSAIIPLLIEEPGSPRCAMLWREADVVVTSTLTFAEVHSALALATRIGRIDTAARARAAENFAKMWPQLATIPPNDAILAVAADLTFAHGLRAYDAIHCATAVAAASVDFFAVSGDRDLLRAWIALGIPTASTAS
ncbi:MAG: VapC toxin family PIN domain ribonuclease [Microbacterium sp.]|nr:MAG: VapC toxin family PIN domain ribonuclease [Microbacterium sp.]